MLSIEFKTDNAAFGDTRLEEIIEIRKVIKRGLKTLEELYDYEIRTLEFSLFDSNGNSIGRLKISSDT